MRKGKIEIDDEDNVKIEDSDDFDSINTKDKKNKKKNNQKSIAYIVVALFVIIIVYALIISLNNVGLLNIGGKSGHKKATLNYTETSEAKSGVTITDVSDVVSNVMPSIVSITSKSLINSGNYGPSFFGYGEDQYTEGAGSGIIVSETDSELLILTNNHVIEGADELSVQFVSEKTADATVKGTSSRKDVAVIAVKLSDLDSDTKNQIKIATIGDSNKLKVGNGIIAIGNALGYGQSVTTGVVSALNREVTIDGQKSKMIQIDAAINGGNSGGALLNSAGEVVGINSAKYSSSSSTEASIEGMGFAIPISDVKDLIEKLMNGQQDSTSSASIGVQGQIISKNNQYNYPAGFYIIGIVKDSGAEKAGLEIGNIITKIEGKKVTALSDIQDVLAEKKKGDTVELTIAYASGRKYEEKTVKVTLS